MEYLGQSVLGYWLFEPPSSSKNSNSSLQFNEAENYQRMGKQWACGIPSLQNGMSGERDITHLRDGSDGIAMFVQLTSGCSRHRVLPELANCRASRN